MEYIDKIIIHPVFVREMKKLKKLEEDRIFCGHDIEHLLSVARIGWIRVMEENLPVSKETLYAAALLHDIGRATQYETGEPHEKAGMRIAKEILTDIGFPEEETDEVLRAIIGHRLTAGPRDMQLLGEVLFRADKKSRNCFLCPASEECNWPAEKKNSSIDR